MNFLDPVLHDKATNPAPEAATNPNDPFTILKNRFHYVFRGKFPCTSQLQEKVKECCETFV